MRNSPPPTTVVAENEDVLTNILVRLPPKSLMQLKCVSKQWLSLICSTEFGLSHTRFRHSNSTPTALLLSRDFKPQAEGLESITHVVPLNISSIEDSLPSFDFMEYNEFQILDSCKGLLLCDSLQNPADRKCFIDDLVICNPATRQSRRLFCPRSLRENYRLSDILVFDPNISPHYKVISVLEPCQQKDRCAFEFHIYSSENDSWASQIAYATDWEFPDSSNFGTHCAFFNGCIHWMTRLPRSQSSQSLLCFSFDAQIFKRLYLPEEFIIWYFGESQGQLNVIGYKDEYNCDVLEIAPDYSGWFVKYHVDIQSLKMEFPGSYCRILSCFRAENDEPVIVVLMDRAIVSYNLPYGTFQKVYDLETRPRYRLDSDSEVDSDEYDLLLDYTFEDSYQYFETLFCV